MVVAPRNPSERLIGLELLRFMAAVGVLVWHYNQFLFIGTEREGWNWDLQPLRWLFAPFYAYGYAGVELFWCISGFIFTWKYGAVIARNRLDFGRFVLLRFSRLYPLHLAMLLIVAMLQTVYWRLHGQTFVYVYNDAAHFMMNLFFANWWGFQSGESFNGPSWSVSAEVLIYLVFFGISRRCGAGWRVDLLALIAFSAAQPIVLKLFGIKLAFTGAGTFFYLGAVTCHLWRLVKADRTVGWGCVALVAAGSVVVALHLMKIAAVSLVIFPAAILAVQLLVRPTSARGQTLLTGLGNLTYASYMTHFPLQLAAMLLFGEAIRGWFGSAWFLLSYIGVVLVVAFCVFRGVERPAQNALRRLGRPAFAEAPPLAPPR